MQTRIKIPIPTQRGVLKDGNEMLNCSSAQGTCGNGHGSELSESAGRTRQHRETCGNGDDLTPRMFRKIPNPKRFRRFKT